jgi:hypothetical protein
MFRKCRGKSNILSANGNAAFWLNSGAGIYYATIPTKKDSDLNFTKSIKTNLNQERRGLYQIVFSGRLKNQKNQL